MKAIKAWLCGLAVILLVLNTNRVNGIKLPNLIPSLWKAPGNTTLLKNNKITESVSVLGNIIESVKDITNGVVSDIPNLLPTPEGLFNSGKNVLVGYPFAFVSSTINQFCSSVLSSQKILPKYTPDVKIMNFQLRTKCENHSFNLLKADKLVKSPAFDPKKKVVVLASGWKTTINDAQIIDTIAQAYLCRGDINFIAVDTAAFVDTLYSWSAFNTEEIGQYIGEGLTKIAKVVPVENIHLIGHSLGSHIMGAAGRYFTYLTGKQIPRITGMDPAKPCFNEGENLSGLQRGDAEFIDVIHSNPGVLGKREPVGDADFYPGGMSPLPPGCIDIVCAHTRAWKYYAETVYPGNENNFMGRRCNSLIKLRENKCPGADYPMGFAVPFNLKGNYFLEVRGGSPFGPNSNSELSKLNKNCGLCEENKN